MTGTMTVPREVQRYVEAVREQLADLPAEEREEVLADVQVAVHEAYADVGEDVEARLGAPSAFAAELRAAAGFPAELRSPSRIGGLLARFDSRVARLSADSRLAWARELAPVWWLARAYVAVAAFTLFTGATFSNAQPALPLVFGGATIPLIVVLAAASVWLGLQRVHGRGLRMANVLLALAALPVAGHLLEGRSYNGVGVWVEPASTHMPGVAIDGHPVRNIYAYSRDGRMLHDVLLYDSEGSPIDIGRSRTAAGAVEEQDPLRRPVLTRDGRALMNAFPIRYFEPGTRRVADPLAGPRIRVPEIVTPPLRTRRDPRSRR